MNELKEAYENILNGNAMEETKSRTSMKASELITILQKLVAENGDLEISVNTQDGASYSLYSKDDINIGEWTRKDGSKVKMIEIG